MAKHIVAKASEIPPGSRKLVHPAGRPIAIFNLSGEFYGLHDKCPHEGGSLCRGAVTSLICSDGPGQYAAAHPGEVVRCPWHGWEFDIRTGKSWCEPERIRVKSYEVAVETGRRLVEGPYVAETVPVSVENDYVVVEV